MCRIIVIKKSVIEVLLFGMNLLCSWHLFLCSLLRWMLSLDVFLRWGVGMLHVFKFVFLQVVTVPFTRMQVYKHFHGFLELSRKCNIKRILAGN